MNYAFSVEVFVALMLLLVVIVVLFVPVSYYFWQKRTDMKDLDPPLFEVVAAGSQKPEQFTSEEIPGWLIEHYGWFVQKHLLTLEVGKSISLESSCFTRIR